MILEAAIEEGGLQGSVDNQRDPQRYVVNLFRNSDGTETARCLLGVAPQSHGLDWTLPGPAGARHQLILAWTPESGTAELFVDGVQRISGYRGTPEFRYDLGFTFGAARYRSQRGVGVFWKIRFEIA
jgi:hypothetical protein